VHEEGPAQVTLSSADSAGSGGSGPVMVVLAVNLVSRGCAWACHGGLAGRFDSLGS
jgi:hypothetical protein